MFFSTFIVCLCISTSFSAPAEQTCPGAYKEGEKVEKASSWFECKSGQLEPKGCLTSNGERLKLQDTYDFATVRVQCQAENGNPTLVNKTCLQNNQEHQPDEKWDDSKYVYTCKKEGSSLTIQPTGCIREGKKVDNGEKMTIGEVVYECKKETSGVPSLKPWGCAKDGGQYPAGETFDLGQFWYTCESKDGIVSLQMSGCVNEKVHFKDGDRFYTKDIIFECVVKQNDGMAKVVGCWQADPKDGTKIERRVGCYWYEGTEPFQVTMTCRPDQQMKTAMAIPVQCNYKMPGDTVFSIDIGCYRIYEKVAVGCSKDPASGNVNVMQIQMDDKGNVQSVPDGLKFC